jgi:hypothetical protein
MTMKTLTLALLSLISSFALSSTGAKIEATFDKSKTVVIALDAKGTPRADGNLKTYPTIKDFRPHTDYSPFCYSGDLQDAKKLFAALVLAADGDGDSWAKLVSIRPVGEGNIQVLAEITDEGGESTESYTFKPCQ